MPRCLRFERAGATSFAPGSPSWKPHSESSRRVKLLQRESWTESILAASGGRRVSATRRKVREEAQASITIANLQVSEWQRLTRSTVSSVTACGGSSLVLCRSRAGAEGGRASLNRWGTIVSYSAEMREEVKASHPERECFAKVRCSLAPIRIANVLDAW
eukprot:3017649-Rhodomonas_salina.3